MLPLVAVPLTGCGGGTPVVPRTTTITITPTAAPVPATSAAQPTTPPVTEASLTPPANYAEAQTHFAAGTVDPAAGSAFTSPTGNIFCDIGAGAGPRGCELKQGRIPPPSSTYCPAGAAAKDIGRVEFTADGPRAVCNPDSIIRPGVPMLRYGSIAKVAGSTLECVSERIGMTCVDTTQQKGFFIARDTYFVF